MVRKNTLAQLASQPTPQTKQAHPKQVPNSAGGWSFQVDHWTQLKRFLILGSEDGTYYITPRDLTLANMSAVQKCLREDGIRTVREITSISFNGRAAKNSPAIFALALAASPQYADAHTNRAALGAISIVCRTAPMLFEFCETINRMKLRGWGRGLRTAVANWFTEMDADKLAYQLVKYRQRNGWTARDVLRLCHPHANLKTDALLRWAIEGADNLGVRRVQRGEDKAVHYRPYEIEDLPQIIQAYEQAQTVPIQKSKGGTFTMTKLIRESKLPREALPTVWLNDAGVWDALLADMPYTAMLRNLATMTRVGLLDLSGPPEKIRFVCDKLTNADEIKRARVHPVAILAALKTYQQGHGIRGNNSWTPHPRIIDALNDAFRLAFGNAAIYEGRTLIAIDVSTSMRTTSVVGLEYVDAIEAAAALALPMLANMPNAFTTAFNTQHQDLTLTARMSMGEAINTINHKIDGGTDCAAPIVWAMAGNRVVDLFVILTDSETWAGNQHPFEALREYRKRVNPNARLAVVAMCANEFSLGSPEDGGSIDLIGFDTNTPLMLEAFANGEI